ncbi:MAG: hypothetical protein ACRD2U_04020, partial [Terriglobales bacterium]
FSCYRRQANFTSPDICDLFVQCLEQMRRRFGVRIYGYVIMPEPGAPGSRRSLALTWESYTFGPEGCTVFSRRAVFWC